jgi:hypothetical protein
MSNARVETWLRGLGFSVTETIVVPPDPAPDTLVTIRYARSEGPVVQTGPRSESGRYGYYPATIPKIGDRRSS